MTPWWQHDCGPDCLTWILCATVCLVALGIAAVFLFPRQR